MFDVHSWASRCLDQIVCALFNLDLQLLLDCLCFPLKGKGVITYNAKCDMRFQITQQLVNIYNIACYIKDSVKWWKIKEGNKV